jgi:hypothetical protein
MDHGLNGLASYVLGGFRDLALDFSTTWATFLLGGVSEDFIFWKKPVFAAKVGSLLAPDEGFLPFFAFARREEFLLLYLRTIIKLAKLHY